MKGPQTAPLDQQHLWREAKASVRGAGGETQVFIRGYEADLNYMMSPGSYVLVMFTDKEGDEKRYALTVATLKGVELTIK